MRRLPSSWKKGREMLSERERRQFEEIVRELRDDSAPDVREPTAASRPTSPGAPRNRWRRLVAWAERRFYTRLARSEMVIRPLGGT